MDIGELLSYKPPITPKRPSIDEYVERTPEKPKIKKHKRIDTTEQGKTDIRPLLEARKDSELYKIENAETIVPIKPDVEENSESLIHQLLDNDAPKEVDIHSELTLKRMILLFEKRALKNREMRIKFTDEAEKFMESEFELHEVLQELHVLATMPDLYPLLVQLNAVSSLLELLSHENTDVAVAVISLLQELTDVDILHESIEGAESLINALLKQEVCALLVQNLDRMDESIKEEFDGVHNTLAIFENIVEFKSDMVDEVGKQGLLNWLLKRIRQKRAFDANKLYASEMLSILLQNSSENRKQVGELDGVDILLQQLAFYKRYDPSSAEETEMMENLFDCLCSCLIEEKNRERFLDGEGLQLMNLMLREKKFSRNGSLKVLDHAMSGPYGAENCNKFVDILGLRTLFPLFMKTPKKNKRRTISVEEHEEHVLSIISSLFRHCHIAQRQRLMSKFIENDCEKVDRLMELHFKYLDKMEIVDNEVEKLKEANKDLSDDELEEEMYLHRLDKGLYTLQLIDYIILEICTAGPQLIKQRVMQILGLRGGTLKTIRQVMREYAGMLETKDAGEWQMEQHYYILQLIDKF